ncbi:helix-turn-helix transcriptional regulator [Candidatus Enterococcus murrayae]|uniref:YafY family transcriptional regulator n=1 Tax=Candidatus Enterococcus murrayae TaxID=2815321 RepID=A0ABS3HGB8_9ENTE|nr:YafY family protein [Enterococcus sp. MJM16]MBO0452495.1 YafY family transcriptional regulator [Enterococcus sp. MJM16]
MIESRLLQILFILLEKGSVTAPELAEKFEVSARTIYRDIDALSAAGIPVYAVRGKGGGIFIQENYVLDRTLFSDTEQREILLALQSLTLTAGSETSPLVSKLSMLFKKEQLDWMEIDFSDWTGLRTHLFDELQRAILSKKVIQISYLSSKGQFTERELEPLKLVFRDKAWYLYAFCRLRDECRLLKITRMRDLRVLSEVFHREIPKKVFAEKQAPPEKIIELTLAFDSGAAYRVQEEFDNIVQKEDGTSIVVIRFPDDESTMNYLFSFGDHLEILAPQDYREKMADRIEQLLNKYRT